MGFLDDLKNQAQTRQAQLRDSAADLAKNAAQVESACKEIWVYLEELGRQLQVLQPASPARFVFDTRAVVEGLRYSSFTADLRRGRGNERGSAVAAERVDHMTLSARLVSGKVFSVCKDFPPEIQRLESRLAQAGIRCVGEPQRDPATGRFLHNRYDFVADLVAGVRVQALHEQGQIRFAIQNFEGLLTTQVSFDAGAVTSSRLDELAKWWVGEPHRFLEGGKDLQRLEPR